MQKILLIFVVASLLLLVESQKTKPPPFSGAYIWGVTGGCDYIGGICTYLSSSLTTCYPWSNCLEVTLNISHYADAVGIEIAGPH